MKAEMEELQASVLTEETSAFAQSCHEELAVLPDAPASLAAVLYRTRARLRSAVHVQLQSSQEQLQSLRTGIKQAEQQLRLEEKLRKEAEKELRSAAVSHYTSARDRRV